MLAANGITSGILAYGFKGARLGSVAPGVGNVGGFILGAGVGIYINDKAYEKEQELIRSREQKEIEGLESSVKELDRINILASENLENLQKSKNTLTDKDEGLRNKESESFGNKLVSVAPKIDFKAYRNKCGIESHGNEITNSKKVCLK